MTKVYLTCRLCRMYNALPYHIHKLSSQESLSSTDITQLLSLFGALSGGEPGEIVARWSAVLPLRHLGSMV